MCLKRRARPCRILRLPQNVSKNAGKSSAPHRQSRMSKRSLRIQIKHPSEPCLPVRSEANRSEGVDQQFRILEPTKPRIRAWHTKLSVISRDKADNDAAGPRCDDMIVDDMLRMSVSAEISAAFRGFLGTNSSQVSGKLYNDTWLRCNLQDVHHFTSKNKNLNIVIHVS